MNAKTTITGTAVCPACQITGHDADSCRANQLSDGRILCIICASFIAPFGTQALSVYRMPLPLKSLVAALLREKDIHAPSLTLAMAKFGPDGSTSQAAYACAQGNESVILNGGELLFSADRYGFSKIHVRFMADELQDIPSDFARKTGEAAFDERHAQFLRNLKDHSCPPALEAAIGKLLALGFTVQHMDFGSSSMRRILLHIGGNIEGLSVPKGIMVEATYLVD